MGKILDKLKSGQVLVSDGAWGTFLQAKGLQPGECPESWNTERPDDVYEIAKSYIDAGSDMIETNTFGGNYFKLKHFGLEEKVYDLNKASAEISRKAAGPDKIVLGSVGPTGQILMMGEVTADELYDAFKTQCIALADGGADAIVVETMTDLEEAKLAIKAAKENTSCEVICTMTFDPAGDAAFFSMMGVSPEQMAQELAETGVDIIGTNCGNGAEKMIEIIKQIRAVNSKLPILVHANAGLPEMCNGETVFPETPEVMGGFVKELVSAGANIVGGCCGTTPEHIKKMVQLVK